MPDVYPHNHEPGCVGCVTGVHALTMEQQILERIATALERLCELWQPAYDINVIQLEMLKAQTRGGIVGASIVPGGKIQH